MTFERGNAYQLVDICRVEVVFDVNPDTVPTYSFRVSIEIDGVLDSRAYFVFEQRLADTSIVISQNDSLPHSRNLRAVAPQSRTNSSSPYKVTIYFALPRSEPVTTEFVFIANPANINPTRSDVYSIAKNCPKGNELG